MWKEKKKYRKAASQISLVDLFGIVKGIKYNYTYYLSFQVYVSEKHGSKCTALNLLQIVETWEKVTVTLTVIIQLIMIFCM